MEEKVIKYTDDNLFTTQEISFKDVEGNVKTGTVYITTDGRVWPDEHMARWYSCTHEPCGRCGTLRKKNGYCEKCRRENEVARFQAMPEMEWDGITPLVEHDSDIYYFDRESIEERCEEDGIDISKLELCICEPNYAHEIDPNDYYMDDLPEDGEVLNELYEAFEKLNRFIRDTKPILSWSQGRARIKPLKQVQSHE